MSDAPNGSDSEAIVQIANEYRRLQRQLESKSQQLEALLEANGEAGDFPTSFEGVRNRRYNIEFQFTPGELIVQERTVTVERGTIFRCAAVESFLRAVGSASDPYSSEQISVQATLPWDQRLTLFDYLWRVRDTGTDREWVDNPQPSLFGGGGYFGPMWLPRRIVLSGGTVIAASVDPFLSNADPTQYTFFSQGEVQSYILQMSFIGHDVPDGSAL